MMISDQYFVILFSLAVGGWAGTCALLWLALAPENDTCPRHRRERAERIIRRVRRQTTSEVIGNR